MKIVIKDEGFGWKLLNMVRGKTLIVDTKYLFRDQFNTIPIRGVSDTGLRIMESAVVEVIDDIRINRSRCNWCGKHFESGVFFCPHCGQTDYIEPLKRRNHELRTGGLQRTHP
jgi:hypothetical protein